MIDCTKTENFLRERNRMCKMQGNCKNCLIDEARQQEENRILCRAYCENHPKEAIAIVQKWSDEHPQKTMLDDFKEKYPNAPLESDGTPKTCPHILGYVESEDFLCDTDGFKIGCAACWNRPYEECVK